MVPKEFSIDEVDKSAITDPAFAYGDVTNEPMLDIKNTNNTEELDDELFTEIEKDHTITTHKPDLIDGLFSMKGKEKYIKLADFMSIMLQNVDAGDQSHEDVVKVFCSVLI